MQNFLGFLQQLSENLNRGMKGTSVLASFVENLLEIQDTLWSPFLFLMNVSFILYALGSQQMLSFETARFLNI